MLLIGDAAGRASADHDLPHYPVEENAALTIGASSGMGERGAVIKGQGAMRDYYSITELTREFGISTRTLRFYEDEGLIKPVRRGRTRLYRPSDRHLVRQILRGRSIGFSIAEIREIIEVYKAPPGEIGQLKLMLARISEKQQDLRQKRRDLEDTLEELARAEEACVERLAELGVTT
jgi:DNA-binding transcriptional MerR regulator